MTSLEHKETMLNSEKSTRHLQIKAPPYNLKYNGDFSKGLSNIKGNTSHLPPNESYYRPMRQHDCYVWSDYHRTPDFQKGQQNILKGPYYPINNGYCFPMDYNFQCTPFMAPFQYYPRDFSWQEFQYFVVIDFEATCDKEIRPHPQEIIEFPSVIVNTVTGQLEDCFQIYVRPTCNPHLTDFCKDLTGIQQVQVDKGVVLSEALVMHDQWLEDKGIKHANFAVVTWSNWDCRVMLESECQYKKIRKPPYFNRWINLRVPFNQVFGGLRCNLKEAVQFAGLVWEGRPHCGLDDAKNTARLLADIMHRGFKFSITNSLFLQTESPLDYQNTPAHHSQMFKHPTLIQMDPSKEHVYCYCGAKSLKKTSGEPGQMFGCTFFGCGNWTTTRGAMCPYFKWVNMKLGNMQR